MIPIRDTLRPVTFPAINWLFIGANTLIFLFEISLHPVQLDRLFRTFGMTPASLQLSNPLHLIADPFPLLTLVTSMFLHGGWFHFLTNIWVLHVFGDNVEDRMGPARYLAFFLLSGVAANLCHALVSSSSAIPAIGASGAIAGVMGAYFLFYPHARIVTLIPVFLIPWFVNLPAIFFLGFWFISQLFSGLFSLGLPVEAGPVSVAWWAHIGGFLFGIFFARRFARRISIEIKHYRDDFPSL